MKVKIRIEKGEEFIDIPLSEKMMHDIYDTYYMVCLECWKDMKRNKCEKSFISFHKKMEHIVHDILGEGKVYSMDEKKKKLSLLKKRHYFGRKPKWIKR